MLTLVKDLLDVFLVAIGITQAFLLLSAPGRDLMRAIGQLALCSWNSVPIKGFLKHVFLICQDWFGQKENCSLICLKEQKYLHAQV